MLEARLCGDAAVLGEHAAEHEDVELRLVVTDEDGRTGGAEDVLGIVDIEGDAGGGLHRVLEEAGGDPLGDLLAAEQGEDDGCDGAEDGAKNTECVGGEAAGEEAGAGNGYGHDVEAESQGNVADEEVFDKAEEEHCR